MILHTDLLRYSFGLVFLAVLGFDMRLLAAEETFRNPNAPVEGRVGDLLGRLTPEEKISLIGGASFFRTKALERLGIPSLKMSDGPFGVRDTGKDNDPQVPGTVYAGGLALGASWDVELARRVGHSLGRDARARGIHIQLAPGMNLYRAPFGGRNFEYFGEDPLLTGLIAAGYIEGLQSEGVAATMKHFVANEQEYDRNKISSEVDERTLRELYLKPFQIALEKSHPWCVMDSYNPINGIHATANDWLNNKVLKGEWKFPGVVMSDWWATHNTMGAANGGLDLEMPGPPKFFRASRLRPLLRSGKVLEVTLDDKVRRILRVMLAMGFLDRPQLDGSIPRDDPDSHATALAGAREGIVLLKNERHLLPLTADKVRKIVVLGHNADPAVAVGGGSAHADYASGVSIWQGLKDEAGSTIEVIKIPWSTLPETTDFSRPPKSLKKAYAFTAYGADGNPPLPSRYLQQIKEADLVVICAGFNDNVRDYWKTLPFRPEKEGESVDRTYELPPGQEKMILAAVNLNPRTAVVLNAGGSVATASWIDKVPVLLDAFYPGQAGGAAVAEIIFGKTNPSGKLTFSWEKKWADSPAYGNYPDKENGGKNGYREGVLLGYRGFDTKNIAPLFPFGFGLSYTTFEYSAFSVSADAAGNMTATCTITNTGDRAGDEIAQLYITPPVAEVARPVHELKAFTRISLPPGTAKSVTLKVAKNDLAYWNPETKEWTVTPGSYTAQAGGSSRDLPLQAGFRE